MVMTFEVTLVVTASTNLAGVGQYTLHTHHVFPPELPVADVML